MKKNITKAKKKKIKSKAPIGFFHSNTAKLFFIIMIALAIPLTVLGVQQVQNLQQEAKEENECTDASYPLQVFPNPAEDGQEITFRLAEGTIDEPAFQNDHFTGNGAVGCQLSGGVIKCKARYNSRSRKPQSDHTYEVHGNKCNYSVKNPDANKPTKPPKTVTNTPKPTRNPNEPIATPKPAGQGNPRVEAEPAGCNASNEPRIRAEWDLSGGEGPNGEKCKVELIDGSQSWTIDTKCTDQAGVIIDNIPNEDDNLVSEKEYTIKVTTGKGASSQTTVKAPRCTSGNEGTPPSQPKLGAPESVSAKCDGNQDNPKLTVSWTQVSVATSYTVRLATTQGGSVVKQGNTEHTSFTFNDIEKDKTYWYTVSAQDASGKKSNFTSNTRNIKCTNSNLSPTGVIGAIANTFEDMMSFLNM